MGRHRAPTKRGVQLARMAVGGLVLAEVTGGFAAIPAYAAEPPHLARTPAGHELERHHHHHRHQVKHKPKPKVQTVVKTETPPVLFSHYTVQPGDTLTHIAAAYGIPFETLWSANTDIIAHPDFLYVGQQLRLPS